MALALAAQQRARNRRPAQHGGIREMEDVVETITVRIIGIVCQPCPERLAVDQDADARTNVAFDVEQFNLKTTRKALAFGKRCIKAQRLSALRSPACRHLSKVGGRDLVKSQVKLARDVRNVPEQIAQLF